MYVADASVLVADARPQEPTHGEARTLLATLAADDQPVFLPIIVLAEVAAAIARGTGQPDQALRLIAALRQVPIFRFMPVDDDLGNLASDIAARHQIRGCDAVYVALAQQLDATLVTLDRQQRERVPPQIFARTPAQVLRDLGL